MKMKLVIGTRGSRLALTQTEMVKTLLLEKFPEAEISVKIIATSGDINSEVDLKTIGGKELFTREIDEAMIRGEIDLAVHSLKDIPGIINPAIEVAAVLERADPRDVLLGASSLRDIPQGAKFGTSSPRRMAQVKQIRPDLKFENFRGNVPTRIDKVANKMVDATLLAKAGIDRLGLDVDAAVIATDEILPAAGQGIIAITALPGNERAKEIVSHINHAESFVQATAERAVLQAYEGNCYTPIAAFAKIIGENITLDALIASEDGEKIYRSKIAGKISEAESLGRKLGKELLEQKL